MKLFYKLTLTVISVLMVSLMASAQNRFFTDAGQNRTLSTSGQRTIIPTKFRTAGLDVQRMKSFLWSLPSEDAVRYNRSLAPVMELPMPNGEMAKFRVWESSIQEPALAAKFPEIRTFAGQGIDDPSATIRFDYNPYFGFSAQILSPNGRIFIDAYARRDVNSYISYYTRDMPRSGSLKCLVTEEPTSTRKEGVNIEAACLGTNLRTYRIAVACTPEYAQNVSGIPATAGPTHAAIVTSVNRVNGVYELELSIRLVLIANNNLIEYLIPGSDPYTAPISTTLLNQNQTNIDNVIGFANYDIGHIFSGDDSGLAQLSAVCGSGKARGATGRLNPTGDPFDIDYVAHEIGHQFGAPHTFNSNTCASAGGSYEPGGGTTIMAYAGICASTENIQPNSDPIFHTKSFDDISNFIAGSGGSCAVLTPTGNTLPVITSMPNNGVSIPINTPFTLTATATDADGDPISYNWEGWDVGAAGSWPSAASSTTRPLFRTRVSKTNGTRVFPDLRVIAANYPGTGAPSAMDGLRGEVLPTVAREMKFRLTVRDVRNGIGGVVSSGLNGCQGTTNFVINAVGSTPFAVTSPNGGEVYNAGTSQTITWNNAGTTAAPFNVANVRVTLSVDGGLTYPHELSASTANDGSEALNLPIIPPTTTARIRIEALGNIFFDISNSNFTINAAPTGFTFNSPAPVVSACPAAGAMQTTLTATYVGGFNTNISLVPSVTPNTPVAPAVSITPSTLTTSITSATVSITNAAALYAGTYTVTVTGTAGSLVQTRDITFTITGGAGPAITTPPANQTVCVGANATFSVVSPTATTYQWQISTPAVPAFTNIGGATSATYTANSVTAGMSGNQYRVIASTQCGSTTSAAATLTVNTAPAITTNPQSITLCVGSNNTFSVGATGSTLTYQWQISTAAVPAFTDIPTATSSSYTVTGITAGMNGDQYRVVVSGACPSPATSNAATLTVVLPVIVTGQPVNSTVCDGANASFTVAGSGTGVIYQWQVNTGAGFVNVPAGAPYSGINAATLNITGVTPAMSGYQYRAQLSNATCTTPTASNAATLTVNTLPAISASPTSATICVGGNNTFTSTASGTGIGYQWQINTGAGFTDIPTASASSYTVTGATAAMNGNQYRVVVTGTCAPPAISQAATLTVISPVTIAVQPLANTEICSGSNTSLTVAGTSTQPITYQWQVNTGAGFNNVANGNGIAGATSATLTFTSTTLGMTGTYRVLLSNTTCTAPTTSANAVVTIRQLPTVGLTATLTSLLPGQTSVLTATPSAQTTGVLTTTWLKNGTAVANAGNTRTVNVENIGTYRVTIQEVFSGVTCSNQSQEVIIGATISDRLFIFPTPNDGNFTVSYYNNGGSSTSRTINIYDSKGNKAFSKIFPITGPYTLIPINMSNAARGIYYVVVGDASGRRLAEGKVHVR